MSRTFKDSMVQTIGNLSGTITDPEKMSGADLERAKLISECTNIPAPNFDTGSLGGNFPSSKVAKITADGVNTVTVDNVSLLKVGNVIDIRSATGVSRAAARNITAINGLVVTYDGADASATIIANDVVCRSPSVQNAALSGADLTYYST